MDEVEAAQFYAKPENQETVGTGRRRTKDKTLSSHVPVRFTPELINAVKKYADEDEVTVSSWIRAVVVREVERRSGALTVRAPGLSLVIERKYGDESSSTITEGYTREDAAV